MRVLRFLIVFLQLGAQAPGNTMSSSQAGGSWILRVDLTQ